MTPILPDPISIQLLYGTVCKVVLTLMANMVVKLNIVCKSTGLSSLTFVGFGVDCTAHSFSSVRFRLSLSIRYPKYVASVAKRGYLLSFSLNPTFSNLVSTCLKDSKYSVLEEQLLRYHQDILAIQHVIRRL